MTDPVQIEIPSFDDDDDYLATPIQFGRQQAGLGLQFGSQGSPAASSSPLAESSRERERSNLHTRTDSAASEYSTHSSRYGVAMKPSNVGHSSNSSIGTTSTSVPTRKTSFASIRNAFKSGKSSDAPPVPTIDPQSYPALKNPFVKGPNSNSSSSSIPSLLAGGGRRPSVNTTPPSAQSPSRFPPPAHSRGPSLAAPTSSKARSGPSHPYGRSDSRSSSFAHAEQSDIIGRSSPMVPPVPRMPNGYHHGPFNSSVLSLPVDPDPPGNESSSKAKTPAEYALHVVFMRFVTCAEIKIEKFLNAPMDSPEPSLSAMFGPDVDPTFESILDSLARIAQKQPKPVVDCIMRWRKSEADKPLSNDAMRQHVNGTPAKARRAIDAADQLTKRKDLASIHILCRALIAVIRSLGKDSLGEVFGTSLESITFDEFKAKPDLKLLAPSPNQRANADLYAKLLGHLSGIRFISVTDKFLHELGPLAQGQVPKDGDPKFENIVKGLRYIELKVYPPEAFEESAEFLEALSKCFANAHGLRLKSAFAEVLVHLLHPVGKTAGPEVNTPVWAKAMDIIYMKAKDMMNKPRYWQVAFPLVVTSLCLSSHDQFLRNWTALVESSLGKLRERNARIQTLNGLIRLFWTYLYRCNEPTSTVTSKLDSVLRHFFPPGRRTVFPDESTEAFIYILHFILSREFEYGQDTVLDFLQASTLRSPSTTIPLSELLPAERTIIAIRAVVLTLRAMETEKSPTWPTNSDFTSVSFAGDYPYTADFLPDAFFAKPAVQQIYDRCGPVISKLATTCSQTVGSMSIFDPRYKFEQTVPPEEREVLVIRHHGDLAVAYPKQLVPQLDILYTCFESWPRCLHPASLALAEVLDMLIRAVTHVEPNIGDAAARALHRFASDTRVINVVLERYTRHLFAPNNILRGTSGRILTRHIPLVHLWVELVNVWAKQAKVPADASKVSTEVETEGSSAALIDDIEAGCLYLLTMKTRLLRVFATKILIQIPDLISKHGAQQQDSKKPALRTIDILLGKGPSLTDTLEPDPNHFLPDAQTSRLRQWREANYPDFLLRLADSDNPVDNQIWTFVFPRFIQTCKGILPGIIDIWRESLNASVLQFHPLVSALAGTSTKAPAPTAARQLPRNTSSGSHDFSVEQRTDIEQWKSWVIALCACALPAESRQPVREHNRVPSDPASKQDRLSSARGLFQLLIPFLACEHAIFQEAAVCALGSINERVFKTLLEDLRSLTRHIHDKSRRDRQQDRLHTAVVRVYSLTAHFIHDPQMFVDQTPGLLLQFVQETQNFLTQPSVKNDWEFSRLRRYFCIVTSHLFQALSFQTDWDRSVPSFMRLTLYRLCEEWCTYGSSPANLKRYETMRLAASEGFRDLDEKRVALERFQSEAALLSHTAVAAMASLCQGAFFPVDSSASPAENPAVERLGALSVLDWINALFSSESSTVRQSGRKALRSLISHKTYHKDLISQVILRSFVTPSATTRYNPFYFDVVADTVLDSQPHHFAFHEIAVLGLSNLGQANTETRRRAFNVLETLHMDPSSSVPLSVFESAALSSAPSIFLRAQRSISAALAASNRDQASAVLSQCALCLPRVGSGQEHSVLQVLQPWVKGIELEDGRLSAKGYRDLSNLFSLSVRYGDSCPDAIQSLWAILVSGDSVGGGNAVVTFLIEQATRRANPDFLAHAKKVVACLCSTEIGSRIFIELCSIIEPSGMAPAQESHPVASHPDDPLFTEDLDALFPPPQSRQTLYPAELALLLLGDIALERVWELSDQLPTLMQAIFSQLDHRLQAVRQQIRRMLFFTLRSWVASFEAIQENSSFAGSPSPTSKRLDDLEAEGSDLFWTPNDKNSTVDPTPKMTRLCKEVLSLLEPFHSNLRQQWGEVALRWGTLCTMRDTACRSFQLFRSLAPNVDSRMLADMLDRLSNVYADTSLSNQSFAKEIISTLVTLPVTSTTKASLLPQLFWCATACLGTTAEQEFRLAIKMFDGVLDKLDFGDPTTAETLRMQKPTDWDGAELSLQHIAFAGLRSSVTYDGSFRLLGRMVGIEAADLLGGSDNRVRYLYTACLPSCLRTLDDDSTLDIESVRQLAMDIANLAEVEGRSVIARILTSFAKNRFKKKEEFLRQSVAALRDTYAPQHSPEIVTLLLSFVLNNEKWLQIKAMLILKLLFQHPDTKTALTTLGSGLLTPLLRLLPTDLAPQALDVLDEPLVVFGGPSTADVVRMSIHGLPSLESDPSTVVFGTPAESGWCVPNPSEQSAVCRRNILAVVRTCKVDVGRTPGSLSMILFAHEEDVSRAHISEPDIVVYNSEPSQSEVASLGDLVSTLHDLNTFFQPPRSTQTLATRLPHSFDTEEAEHRVAAILSRSLAASPTRDWEFQSDHEMPGPSTPFAGLFASSSRSPSGDSLHRFSGPDSGGDAPRSSFDMSVEPSLRSGKRQPRKLKNNNLLQRRELDSDSDDGMNSFSLEDPMPSKSPRNDGRRRSRVRDLLGSRLSPKAQTAPTEKRRGS